MRVLAIILSLNVVLGAAAEVRTLSHERFRDKMKGAWAGQMFGVCYGEPWEFQSNGAMITKELGEWKPERMKCAIKQDDCYVEMTFLKAIEDFGLDVTSEEAGKAFGESQYPLWHANRFGRNNIRRGIMPPLSGNPNYNLHADDIDFQIEADLFGILCPGLPQESNRLCDIFGHIMNYGDGVYGGMFVSGMYAAAYFEDADVPKVIKAGLACIPAASTYHQCISDVIQWHGEHPDDWQATWKLIEAKWQDDVDCMPGNSFNIDAKLNGAYIVMGLLYGEGDLLKTAEYAIRCGQDADCNPSNAAGVLGCMKGLSGLGPMVSDGIPAIAGIPFDHTAYSFDGLVAACERVTHEIIQKTGGSVGEGGLKIATQRPIPAALEQWADKKVALKQVILDTDIKAWHPAFSLVLCGKDMEPGLLEEHEGKKLVLVLHPVSETVPAAVKGTIEVPQGGRHVLTLDVASFERGNFVLDLLLNGKPALEQEIDTKGAWKTVEVPLPASGGPIEVEIRNRANGWAFEAAYLARPQVVSR